MMEARKSMVVLQLFRKQSTHLPLPITVTKGSSRCGSQLATGSFRCQLPIVVTITTTREFSTVHSPPGGELQPLKITAATAASATSATNPTDAATGLSITMNTATNTVNTARELRSAAEKAERLLNLSPRRAKRPVTLPNPEDAAAAIHAAKALLVATNSSRLLVNNIRTNATMSPCTKTIHRAFLELTSWCLDNVELQGAWPRGNPNRDVSPALEHAIDLARRAAELDLPLHLPLYYRLMETLAWSKQPPVKRSRSALILAVSQWMQDKLGVHPNYSQFRSSFRRLIESRRVSCALDLMEGIREYYKIDYMDLTTISEVLMSLRDLLRDVYQDASADGSHDHAYSSEMVARLQSSLLRMFSLDYVTKSEFRAEVRDLIESLPDDDVEDFLETVLNTAAVDNDKNPGKNKESRLDSRDLSVLRSLTKHVSDPRACRLIADLLVYCDNSSGSPDSSDDNLPDSMSDDEHDGDSEEEEDDDDDDDDDEEGEDESAVFDQFVSMRDGVKKRKDSPLYQPAGSLRIPDISQQVISLNGGRQLYFTRLYDDILWKRHMQETENDSELDDDDFFGTGDDDDVNGPDDDDDY